MRLRGALLPAFLLTLALAGCAAEEGGALSAYDTAQGKAEAWASDAVLLSLGGLESDGNATGFGDAPFALGETKDAVLGDGIAPVWVALFYSASEEAVAFVQVIDGEAQDAVGLPGEFPMEVLEDATFGEPSMDSIQVMDALREGDAALAAILDGTTPATLVSVIYAYESVEDTWAMIAELSDGRSVMAAVQDETGDVLEVQIDAEAPVPTALEPIIDDGTVTAAFDPLNFVTGAPCASPTGDCREYEFTVEAPTPVSIELTWGLEASDFDFYLYKDGEEVTELRGANDVTSNPVTTMEQAAGTLAPGDYTLMVVPWAVAQDSYHLEVLFE